MNRIFGEIIINSSAKSVASTNSIKQARRRKRELVTARLGGSRLKRNANRPMKQRESDNDIKMACCMAQEAEA